MRDEDLWRALGARLASLNPDLYAEVMRSVGKLVAGEEAKATALIEVIGLMVPAALGSPAPRHDS